MGEVEAGMRMLTHTTRDGGSGEARAPLGWLTCLDMESMRRT